VADPRLAPGPVLFPPGAVALVTGVPWVALVTGAAAGMRSGSESDKPVRARADDRVPTRLRAELAVDRPHVRLEGVRRDEER
jgi:hypothetical protein